jgi:hypothetical protein
MIDFKSLTPSYERHAIIRSRADLRSLGCSADLIENVCLGGPDDFQPLWPPEEWFWADRRRFGHGADWVEELYQIAGGCFAELPFRQQCELLDLSIRQVAIPRAANERSKWLTKAGEPVGPELAVLDHLLGPGEIGFAVEGNLLGAISAMTNRIAKHRFKREFDLNQAAGLVPMTDEHVDQLTSSLDIFLDRAEHFTRGLWPHMKRIFRDVSVEDLVLFADRAGGSFIKRVLALYFRHHLPGSGHPDLTIIGDDIRFVEVKVKDRLWGTQAEWVRNVARPLNLSVSVAQVIEA